MRKRFPKRIPVPPFTDPMYERALKNSRRPQPFDVVTARYDRKEDMLHLTLRKGVRVQLPRAHIRELAKAAPDELATVEIQPGGDGLTFRRLNADIYVPGLLAGEPWNLFCYAF